MSYLRRLSTMTGQVRKVVGMIVLVLAQYRGPGAGL